MTRALIIKELRECLPLLALAALAAAYVLGTLWGVQFTPWDSYEPVSFPFFGDGFEAPFGLIGPTLAIILGMKQTHWEVMRGTFPYLLYHPMSRRQIMLLKFAVGGGLLAAGSAAVILLHGIHATKPGVHAFPFFWSMTVPAWKAWFALPLVYAAAFLSGIRPGRWFGSKLLPLAGGCIAALALATQPWWWVALVGSAIGTAACMSAALQVAETRDY